MIEWINLDFMGLTPATWILAPLILGTLGWCLIRLVALFSVYPKYPIGLPGLPSLQGYFYTNHAHYSRLWARQLLEPLASMQQVFEQLSPEKIVAHQVDQLRPQLDGLIDSVMQSEHAILWENLPILLKNRFYSRTHRMLPRIVDDIVEELNDGTSNMLSYIKLLDYIGQSEPKVLKECYQVLCKRSLSGMSLFALLLGFIAGLLQCSVATMVNTNHVLYWSLSSALMLFAVYWIAQRWVLLPTKPLVFGPVMLFSPFHRFRQKQDNELARLIAYKILTVRNITGALFKDSNHNHIDSAIRRRLATVIEDVNIRTFVQLSTGPVSYAELKNSLCETLSTAFLEPLNQPRFNEQRANVMYGFLLERCHKLPDSLILDQVKRILDPLSFIGGISGFLLGLLAGAMQWSTILL